MVLTSRNVPQWVKTQRYKPAFLSAFLYGSSNLPIALLLLVLVLVLVLLLLVCWRLFGIDSKYIGQGHLAFSPQLSATDPGSVAIRYAQWLLQVKGNAIICRGKPNVFSKAVSLTAG